MASSPLAVANYFTELNGGRAMSNMKVQKLCYLGYAWYLAVKNETLFSGGFEAWDGGPVSRDLYRETIHGNMSWGYFCDKDKNILKEGLGDEEHALLRAVWDRYGDMSGQELSDLTHQPGTPWTETYFKQGRNAIIPDELIKSHFTQLAHAGREQ